jgi:hypothetical protein
MMLMRRDGVARLFSLQFMLPLSVLSRGTVNSDSDLLWVSVAIQADRLRGNGG